MVMDQKTVCPSCRQPIAFKGPLGLCPACLIQSGLNTGEDPGTGAGSEPGFVPEPPEEIAKRFPQLEILEFIGKGGMGAVYKARQRNLDRLVALKVLPLVAGRERTFAERFAREAKALARLNHPNIVSIYDSGQQDGFYYFVMEFVDGVNLRQLERSRRPTPEEALGIVPPICEALQYAHQQGIIHRDIKPENILIDKQGRVKIADFGIAKVLDTESRDATLTGAQQVMGTPHYMAPEQVERPATVDHRADIYSLGVVFYELLTGELPLGKFALPSEKARLDRRLDGVVLRALEKDPERRYQQASEVRTQVETIATGRAIPEGNPSRRDSTAINDSVRQRWRIPTVKRAVITMTGVALAGCLILLVAALPAKQKQVASSDRLLAADASWFLAGSNVVDYATLVDRGVSHNGKAGICLKSVVPEPEGFGTLMQICRAETLRGKRVQMSGYVRSDGVKERAGLWLRADGPGGDSIGYTDMQNRPIRGTRDWTRYELALDIPAQAKELAFGLQLVGSGKLWLVDLKFEVVGSGAREPGQSKVITAEEIRTRSVAEWFDRLGRDNELGYAPFTGLNALVAKAQESDTTRDQIIGQAAEAIDDARQNEFKRWQCCYVLSGVGDPRGIRPIARALKDKSDTVRGVAACALGAYDQADARVALEQAARDERDPKVRETIQKALQGEFRKKGKK